MMAVRTADQSVDQTAVQKVEVMVEMTVASLVVEMAGQ